MKPIRSLTSLLGISFLATALSSVALPTSLWADASARKGLQLSCAVSEGNRTDFVPSPEGLRKKERERLERELLTSPTSVLKFSSGYELRSRYADPSIKSLGEILMAESLQAEGARVVPLILWKRILSQPDLPQSYRLHAFRCAGSLVRHLPLSAISLGKGLAPERLELLRDLAPAEQDEWLPVFIAQPNFLRVFTDSHFTNPSSFAAIRFAVAVDANDSQSAAQAARDFFRLSDSALSPHPLSDFIALQAGRVFYELGQDTDAQASFRRVSPRSNLKIDALENLQWSLVRSGKIPEALGVGISLQSSAFGRAWTVESRSLQAMSYQEYCHYPEAAQALERAENELSLQKEAVLSLQARPELSQSVLELLGKNARSEKLHRALAQDLARREPFIQSQVEVLSLKKELSAMRSFETAAIETARTLSREFEKQKAQLETRLAAGEELTSQNSTLRSELLTFRAQLLTLKRIAKGSKGYQRIRTLAQSQTSGEQSQANQKRLSAFLTRQLQTALTSIEETQENLNRVGVAIHRSASRDMIWKNAHPTFEGWIERHGKQLQSQTTATGQTTYHWGKVSLNADAPAADEIWEDEIDALHADISNNCKGKRAFLKLGARGPK